MFEKQTGPAPPKPFSVAISRTVNAGAQTVYDQWLIPVFIGTWMFDPQATAERAVKLENEVRRGGSFCFDVQRSGVDVSYSGEYLELDIPNRLVFSWSDSTAPEQDCQITVTFEEAQGKTRMKLQLRAPPELMDQRDVLKRLWTARCSALTSRYRK